MEISKKDWKLFREKLSGWQENYMEGLAKEYVNFLNDDKKPAKIIDFAQYIENNRGTNH